MAGCLFSTSVAEDAPDAESKKVRIVHEIRDVEGWRVLVDVSLLKGEAKPTGDLALKILGQRLHRIKMRVPEKPVAKMQEIPIFLDRAHPLGGAHFHPSADWLAGNGYDPAMGESVHLTSAQRLIDAAKRSGAGCVVLHELAHAYHFRELGFDDQDIVAGYEQFKQSGKFEMVPYGNGQKRPHYGLMNQMEYFAEMTEAFFVSNDFFPFVRTEIAANDPHTYQLIGKIWGVKTKVAGKRRLDRQDLMILATVKSDRGMHDEALELLDQAEKQNPGNHRIASLRKKIESARSKAKAE
ncbi:MAG: hypothetical protein ACON5N_19210 [Akkermansiaceae bacterium]